MSRVTPATAKRRLLKLADFLESKVDNVHFDFSSFGHLSGGTDQDLNGKDALAEANLCGTKACALGWAPALPFARKLGFKLEIRHGHPAFTKNGRHVSTDVVAKELFGLKVSQWTYIFYDSSLTRPGSGSMESSRADVARGIRTFVAIRFG